MLFKKTSLLLLLAGTLCSSGTIHAQVTTGVPILIDVGATNDPSAYISYLVIDDQSLGNQAYDYAWYYTNYNDTNGGPQSGLDMLNAVESLTVGSSNRLTAFTEGSDDEIWIDGFQVGEKVSAQVTEGELTNTSWFSWLNGGTADYYDNEYPPISPTNWTPTPDTIYDSYITNGSSIGFTLSAYDIDYNPTGGAPLSAAAVPEPAAFPLALLSLATLIIIFRWKPSKRSSLG